MKAIETYFFLHFFYKCDVIFIFIFSEFLVEFFSCVDLTVIFYSKISQSWPCSVNCKACNIYAVVSENICQNYDESECKHPEILQRAKSMCGNGYLSIVQTFG